MAKISSKKYAEQEYQEYLDDCYETGQTSEFNPKFRKDNIEVTWELEEGDWQCPTCSAIVENADPACLCQLAECVTDDMTIDLELLPF